MNALGAETTLKERADGGNERGSAGQENGIYIFEPNPGLVDGALIASANFARSAAIQPSKSRLFHRGLDFDTAAVETEHRVIGA